MLRSLMMALALAVALGGCALDPNTSFVAATGSADDNAVIASGVTDFLHAEFPAARSTVIVEPAASGGEGLLELVRDDLRRQGFAIAQPNSGASGAQSVRLLVTPLYNGFVVRIDYVGQQASTYFGRDSSGQLQASLPFMRRVVTE